MTTINPADFVYEPSAEEVARDYNYRIRTAAREKRNKIIADCFQWAGFLTVCAVVLCALNGVWWPFWYITLPITAPLFFLYVAFDGVTIAPTTVIIFLLAYMAFKK